MQKKRDLPSTTFATPSLFRVQHYPKNNAGSQQRMNRESGAGFTLIELLVVIAIVAILPVAVLSNFPQIKLQFALSRATYEFLQQARLAQDMVLASKPYKDTFNIEQKVAGYGIYIDTKSAGNKKYIVYADRLPGNNQYDPDDYVIKTVDINASEPGISIVSLQGVLGGSASINFAVPDAAVSISQLDKNSTGVQVLFGIETDPSKTKSVVINTAGLIEIK